MKNLLRAFLVFCVVIVFGAAARAAITTIDFDDPKLLFNSVGVGNVVVCAPNPCTDNRPLGNFYAGMGINFNDVLGASTASNVWMAGTPPVSGTLNPDFPPQSLNSTCNFVACGGVAYDSGPATFMQINFTNLAQPVRFVTFYFTTNDNMSIQVFDTNGNLLSAKPDFFVGCNYVAVYCFPNQPNIKYSAASAAVNIGEIALYSDDGPNSFTIDSLSFGAPEPASLLLLGSGAATILSKSMRRRRFQT